MMPAALAHTPSWVFFVFAALLLLGYQQSRDRTVGPGRLIFLPIAMLGLSFFGIASAFGLAALPVGAWLLGVSLITLPGLRQIGSFVRSNPANAFRIPGSWLPLALMMAIFFIKYLAGYALARGLVIASEPWFVGGTSLAQGLLSGFFPARATAVWLGARKASSNA